MRKLWSGRARIYFNRHSDAPYVWSVDQGSLSTERNSVEVHVRCHVDTRYLPLSARHANTEEPAAWLECLDADVWLDDKNEIWVQTLNSFSA